jgi:hypothetical protein|nr:MAG TPA: hypothetical protein [Caudoviricetes sp.]
MFKRGQIARDNNGSIYSIRSMEIFNGFYRVQDVVSGKVLVRHASNLKLIGNNFKFKGVE